MRKRVIIAFLSIICLGTSLRAQKTGGYYAADRTSYPKEMELAGELISYLALNVNNPVGDWAKTYSFGVEPEFGLRYHANENWSITGRAAFNYLFGQALEFYQPFTQKNRYDDAKQFTITGGGRYNFNQNVWLNAELGYSNVTASTSSGGVTWGLSGGYDLFTRRNILGFGLGYQHFKIESTSANAAAIKVRIYFGNREKIRE
jgi:hypothetical protein